MTEREIRAARGSGFMSAVFAALAVVFIGLLIMVAWLRLAPFFPPVLLFMGICVMASLHFWNLRS